MNAEVSIAVRPKTCPNAARAAIAAAGAVLLLLASLHVLSPEFDPSWRVVSEYANGRYGWVLSLMFASWALSSWALAAAVWPRLEGFGGHAGGVLLVAAGVGEAMASLCDINHPLHGLAGMIGVLSLPIAAVLISARMARVPSSTTAKVVLLWTAHLTWISLVLLVAALLLMMSRHAGTPGGSTPQAVAVVGWANRLMVVVDCAWVAAVASQALQWGRLHRRFGPPC
jgi:hypothetical protein